MSLVLLLYFALASIVFIDRRMNGRNGWSWGVLVFFTGVVGLVIYIIVNRRTLKFRQQFLGIDAEAPEPAPGDLQRRRPLT